MVSSSARCALLASRIAHSACLDAGSTPAHGLRAPSPQLALGIPRLTVSKPRQAQPPLYTR